ncbi:bacteriohemerythrin [Maridesulfovibrio hydrothermalis]|uniref:Hemerythrin-like metal-binding protein n=1 Tax=Maridesulfovibrio hydrothermalis AM13 = DSM 14728 TaxID=1121451 RepID=L0RE25_9BACT|nr:bacteriohemerythrin [Maridesulfovibrio hydrothermalis]CCO24452.1 Hemerythrin-like metal-binding protein [Maridesulfovibrio hydrothermalis AM13 = DSM 14728]
MTKINPHDPLHTGIGIIDSQHQMFFTLLKKIKDHNFKQNPDGLSDIIDELHLYTLFHFETEEKLLEEYNAPEIEKHKKMHAMMADKIEEYRLHIMTDSCILTEEISIFLENWLVDHIQNTDIKAFASI